MSLLVLFLKYIVSIESFMIMRHSKLFEDPYFVGARSPWIPEYSARRLIGSRLIESAAYCNQILLVPLYPNSTQNPSVY